MSETTSLEVFTINNFFSVLTSSISFMGPEGNFSQEKKKKCWWGIIFHILRSSKWNCIFFVFYEGACGTGVYLVFSGLTRSLLPGSHPSSGLPRRQVHLLQHLLLLLFLIRVFWTGWRYLRHFTLYSIHPRSWWWAGWWRWGEKGRGSRERGGNVSVTRVTRVVKMKQSASDCLGVSARIEIF